MALPKVGDGIYVGGDWEEDYEGGLAIVEEIETNDDGTHLIHVKEDSGGGYHWEGSLERMQDPLHGRILRD